MRRYLKSVMYQHGAVKKEVILQFDFKSDKQFAAWEKELIELKQSGKQDYIINYFLNLDGTLRYQELINTINQAIESEATSLIDYLSKQNLSRSRHDPV